MWGALFCVGAYKCDVVVVTCIHGVLIIWALRYLHVKIASLAIVKSCATAGHFHGRQIFHLMHLLLDCQP